MKNIIFIISLVALFIYPSCQKEDLMSFESGDKVYIFKHPRGQNKDSVTYSFAIEPLDKLTDTIEIPLRIMGNEVDYNRSVAYHVVDSLSEYNSENFDFLPASIPAGEFTGTIPIKINRSELLKEKELRLWIELQNSEDFQTGVDNQLRYLIKLNDYLSKPASWSDGYFGQYSQEKYGLIIRETGYSSFSDLSVFEFRFIAQTCKNVIREFEVENGTWYDELGNPIRFP